MTVHRLLQKKITYTIFAVLVILFVALINLSFLTEDTPVQQPIPTPTPAQREGPILTEEEPLIPTPNPTYETKIRQEPFWTRLPYWTERYKIEYRDSADVILIHLFLPKNATNAEKNTLQTQYRDEALRWLKENGANLEKLDLQYRIYE